MHRACNLLARAKEPEERLAPMEHGWEDFGTLLPSKCLKPLPRVCSQCASVQASVTHGDVAAVLLEFCALYSAMEEFKYHVKSITSAHIWCTLRGII